MSNSLWPHGLQHTRLPCPLLCPRVCSNSCPLSRWCHLTILILCHLLFLLLLLLVFPSKRVFPNESDLCIRWPKCWSLSFRSRPSNVYSGYIPLGLTSLISLEAKGLSRVFSSNTIQKHQSFCTQPSLWSNSHIHMWLLGKNTALTTQTSVSKVMPLLFITLPRFVIASLLRSKCLNCVAVVTVHSDFGAQENKICHCFRLFPFYFP